MSAKLMGAVWDLDLSHGKQLVLLALADHAHDDGTHCYPGVPYLAHKTGYTQRNVTRILSELEADEIIESEDKSGGRGRSSGYILHLEKGDKKDEYKPRQVTQRVTSQPIKGDKPAVNPDKSAVKGDNTPRANIEEPSENHHKEPSEEEESARETPVPDDTTSKCLLLLRKVPGIGKNYGELAVLLGELREKHPGVDPVEVCEEYELYHRAPPKPTKNHALKLHRFFVTAASGTGKLPPQRNADGPARDTSRSRAPDEENPYDLQAYLEGKRRSRGARNAS